ncbi:hypothetical protein ACROYT_G000737 [Oculina patagonica]
MRLDQNPLAANLATDIERVKLELQRIAEHKTKGAIIRSRARWYEHGERNTKYFMNLEKRSHERKHIVKLKTDQNEYVEEPNRILCEMETFYKALYASQITDNTFDASAPSFLNLDNVQRLDSEQQKSCEGLITEEECLAALKTFEKNKTPGSDGLTTEFYLCFWDSVVTPLIDCLNEAYHRGEMSISQRRGVISLLPKKNKDTLLLKNWRPITLLNIDYKIATKCIGKRLEKVLPTLINNDQTGYVKNRFIGENIRLISDVIEFYEKKQLPGMLLFIDFEKAFDSLEWKYLFKVLELMNFGPIFQKWIHIFYSNITSCVINNGFASDFFQLQRGVRQGCPLSGLLFVLAIEFIWNFKPDKVKRNTLIGPIEKGGLNMVDFNMMNKSLKGAWVKRLYEAGDNKWCSLFSSATSQYGGSFLLECNFNVSDLNFVSYVPSFYKEVLNVWQELHSKDPSSAKEYENEIIWNNRYIKIDGMAFQSELKDKVVSSA